MDFKVWSHHTLKADALLGKATLDLMQALEQHDRKCTNTNFCLSVIIKGGWNYYSVIVVPYKRTEAGSCCAMNWSCVFFPPFLCSFATNVVLMFCLRSGECEGGVEVECRTERSCVACGGVDRLPWWTHCRWPRRSCTAYEWQCSKWHKWAGTLSFELMFGWG